MNINITARHFEVTPVLRERLIEKLTPLEKFYGRNKVIDVQVTLTRDGSLNTVELRMPGTHNHFFVAEVTSDDIYGAIDQVVDKAERQLGRQKERLTERKGRQGPQQPPLPEAPPLAAGPGMAEEPQE